MEVLSSLARYLPTWNTTPEPVKRLFTKCQSTSQATIETFQAAIGSKVLNELTCFQLLTATISKTDKGIDFDYTDREGTRQSYSFSDDGGLETWLDKQKEVDIWEIEDFRKSENRISYRLLNVQDHFKSDKALVCHIKESFGCLFKIEHRQGRDRVLLSSFFEKHCVWDIPVETLFIYARKNGSFEAVTTKKAYELTQTLDLELVKICSSSREFSWKAVVIRCLALIGGFSLAWDAASRAFPVAAAQNVAPTLTGPSPFMVTVNPGQMVNIDIPPFFADADLDTLTFTSTTLPTFLTYNPAPTQFAFRFNVSGNNDVEATQIVGNRLHAFSGGGVGMPGYSINDLDQTPPQTLATFGLGFASGAVDGSFTYLPASSALEVADTSQATITQADTLSASSAFQERIALEPSRDIAWVNDDRFLNATDISNPNALVRRGSFLGENFVSGIVVGPNGRVYMLTEFGGGLRIINGTDPDSLTEIDFMPLSDVPSGLDCRSDECFVGKRFNGVDRLGVGNNNIQFQSNFDLGGSEAFRFVRQRGILYVTRDDNIVHLLHPRDPSNNDNISPITTIATQAPANSVEVVGQEIYISTEDGIEKWRINQDRVTGTPTPDDRGIFTFMITANDFNGGQAQQEIMLEVVNQDPFLVSNLPAYNGVVGEQFTGEVPQGTFSDPENDAITIDIEGLPGFTYNPATRTFSGIPTEIGQTDFSITASDAFGGFFAAATTLQVQGAGGGSGGGGGVGTPTIAGAAAGAVVCLCLAGCVICAGAQIRVRRRQRQMDLEANPVQVNMDFDDIAIRPFGDGKFGELVEWRPEHIRECYRTTWIAPDEKGEIARGNYGVVSMIWNTQKKRFEVRKKVTNDHTQAGRKKVKESQFEGESHLEAAKIAKKGGVFHISRYGIGGNEEDPDHVIIILPPAGLGSINDVSRRIAERGLEESRELFGRYLFERVLKGFVQLHKAGRFHMDMKGANCLVDTNGTAGLSDFGTYVKTKRPEDVVSDMAYKSPEQQDRGEIYSDKEDGWATGVAIAEFLLGYKLFSIKEWRAALEVNPSYSYTQFVQEKLAPVTQLVSPSDDSLWYVAKKFLAINPKERWTAADAAKAKCFKGLKVSGKAPLFAQLSPSDLPQDTVAADEPRTYGPGPAPASSVEMKPISSSEHSYAPFRGGAAFQEDSRENYGTGGIYQRAREDVDNSSDDESIGNEEPNRGVEQGGFIEELAKMATGVDDLPAYDQLATSDAPLPEPVDYN